MSTMPEPSIDPWNKPFWDACNDDKLVLQRCRETGRTWYPPGPVSPFAPRAGWDWVECSGRAKVLSFVVFHQKYFSGFADRLPYNCALVGLEGGARMVSNIMNANDEIEVGQEVELSFERRGAFNVPVFRIAQ